MALSPKQQFAGQTVLLTGGLGYLGSTVLEQLLRLTEVKHVYLLVRGKRQKSASQRMQQLLCGPLFNMLHAEAAAGTRNVFSRVSAVEGDLSQPGLGLTAAARKQLQQEVGIVIHCAANLELEADIQVTLRDNYCGTQQLMQLASGMSQLKAFVHTSTYFVNNHLPRNSTVREQIYPMPLMLGNKQLSHEQFVAAVLAMQPEEANRQVAGLMHRYNFTSTYAFGKRLTELLVDETPIRPGVARAIVRPSLIAGIAGDPYPGYIQGYAGAPGYIMGYAIGLFQGISSVAYSSDTLLDLIPADTVAALLIAGAAGAAAASSAGSPTRDQAAVIYHAASAESNPLSISDAFEHMAKFWTSNPPPGRLVGISYPTFNNTPKHTPNQLGIKLGQLKAAAKVLLMRTALHLACKGRAARALKVAFSAFCVHNSLPYNRSMVCCVDNARTLLAQIAPQEQQVWRVVWEAAQMDVAVYGYTFMAGVRRLLFRMEGEVVTQVPHFFSYKGKGATAAELGLGPVAAAANAAADAAAAGGSSSSTCEVRAEVRVHGIGAASGCSSTSSVAAAAAPAGSEGSMQQQLQLVKKRGSASARGCELLGGSSCSGSSSSSSSSSQDGRVAQGGDKPHAHMHVADARLAGGQAHHSGDVHVVLKPSAPPGMMMWQLGRLLNMNRR